MFELLAVILGSYLVGSIPFAYFVVRLKGRIDVRDAGSGKAGAFNAYVVTHSKLTGLGVGLLDALKGLAAVYVTALYFPGSFWFQSLALLGAVGGHILPIWTGFKGGRGLATTAGGMLVIGFAYAAVWCTLWVIARLFRREILWANLAAILGSPVILWLIPWEWSSRTMLASVDRWTFIFFSCIVSFVLLISHLDALHDVWKGISEPEKNIPSST
ncbi:MAG TPA: glycerol-3-phosphate acyltransferase [Bacteroidetes bacterium]|nr:glycerol-3-phosphate acyltransferase [Bacteroidota bacterium]